MNQGQLIIIAFPRFYAIQKILMHIIRISRWLRQHTELIEFAKTFVSFGFKHHRIGFNASIFRIYPFKKRIATFTKFFVIKHCANNIGQKF